MGNLEPVFVLNPLINQYQKKYIYGVNGKNANLFMELCTRRMRIDGFVDDKNAGIEILNKPTYFLEEIEKESSILLSLCMEEELKEYHVCTDICILNPALYGKKIYIYGAGEMGRKVYPALKDKEVEIVGYIDTDKSKEGSLVYEKKVYNNDILNSLSKDTVIIEAGGCFKEIDKIVENANDKLERFYVAEMPCEADVIWADREKNMILTRPSIYSLCKNFKGCEIILYGSEILLAQKYAEVFKCLDFEPVTIMVDGTKEEEREFPTIDEVLYRDNYLILMYGQVESYIYDKLVDLGVEKNTGHVDCPFSNRRRQVLDVNLGYTYEMNFTYPGFHIYGKNLSTDYKIAILGGSTTDSGFSPEIRPWAEILYEEYCPENVTIWNGGISGYYSGQELIKLTRDIVKMKPNMVIVYDGFNDAEQISCGTEFLYMQQLMMFANRHISLTHWDLNTGKMWKGLASGESIVDDWLMNIEMMHAVASERNIEFFSFLQPSLATKKTLDQNSYELLQMYRLHCSEKDIENLELFRLRAKEIADTHKYIYDLTYIFDDVDVYMDICHVYENGNQIIAKHIWNTIKDRFF